MVYNSVMACFRTHVSYGAIVGMIGVVLAYYYAFTTDWRLLSWIFIVSVFASFLPDIDSDSGLAFHIIFGAFTVAISGIVLLYTIRSGTNNIYEIVGQPLLALFFTWFVVGAFFKKFTHHRGIVHSIPALLIALLVTFISVSAFTSGEYTALLIALSVGAGYLSHLILDEIFSTVGIDGADFHAKRSLGTALKFFSKSKVTNIFTYTLLAILVYIVV